MIHLNELQENTDRHVQTVDQRLRGEGMWKGLLGGWVCSLCRLVWAHVLDPHPSFLFSSLPSSTISKIKLRLYLNKDMCLYEKSELEASPLCLHVCECLLECVCTLSLRTQYAGVLSSLWWLFSEPHPGVEVSHLV